MSYQAAIVPVAQEIGSRSTYPKSISYCLSRAGAASALQILFLGSPSVTENAQDGFAKKPWPSFLLGIS